MTRVMLRRLTFAVVAFGVAMLIATPPAEAAFRLRIEDLSNNKGVVITDAGALDSNLGTGAITYIGTIGTNFSLTVTTGLSKPGQPLGHMDLSSVEVNATGAGTLQITLVDDNFVGPPPGSALLLEGHIGGTMDPGVTFVSKMSGDGANGEPVLGVDQDHSTVGTLVPPGPIALTGTVVPLLSLTNGTSGTLPFAASASGPFVITDAGGKFSLEIQETITFTKAGTVSFNHAISATPEPATVAMAVSGLPMLAFGMWLRRRRSK